MANADGLSGQSKTTSNEIRHGGFEPGYVRLLRSGVLAERVQVAERHLEDCDLCARYCHVNRRESIRGAVCRAGLERLDRRAESRRLVP